MRRAEDYLEDLAPVGSDLGLDRIEELGRRMGRPQDRYLVAHLVGTNGKTSVARAIEGLLTAHGVRAGSYLSPHLESWTERITIAGRPVEVDEFDRAVEEVAAAAEPAGAGGPVTQFEAATAAAFAALADAGVEAAAIEAGLGGRLDATNVVKSRVTVLTSVGLDHTEWLGRDELSIAAEKLAVLREGTTLVLGPVTAPVQRLADETARDRGARVIRPVGLAEHVVPGKFRRQNLALAVEASRLLLEELGREFELDDRDLARVAADHSAPGRLERVGGPVDAVLDVAHNPSAAAALAEALGEVAGDVALVGCVALLGDKDAAGFARAVAPRLSAAICTEVDPAAVKRSIRPGAEPMAAAELAASFRAEQVPAEIERNPIAALEKARSTAAERGEKILVTGSHHLVATAREALLCDD